MRTTKVTDPIKVAQPRTNEAYKRNYIPKPHPQEARIREFRELTSLWSPEPAPTGK